MDKQTADKWDLTFLLTRYKAAVWEQYITPLLKVAELPFHDHPTGDGLPTLTN